MKKLKEYIEMLEEEIDELIGEECEEEECTPANEADLHILFENRKHAIEYLREKEARHHEHGHN